MSDNEHMGEDMAVSEDAARFLLQCGTKIVALEVEVASLRAQLGAAREALLQARQAIIATGAWRCNGCGQYQPDHHNHVVPDHHPGCDGSCRNCPVAIECGPVVDVTKELVAALSSAPRTDSATEGPDGLR